MECKHCDATFRRKKGIPIPSDCCRRCYEEIAALDIGRKDDSGKAMMDLIPPHAELMLAKVLTFGAEKYGAWNWSQVDDLERRYMAAAMRHINAHRAGELLDQESGLPHLAHAMCCLAFLIEKSA